MNPVFKHLPLKPLKSTCLTLLFAIAQVPLMGSFFSEPVSAQTACPAGTQARTLDWSSSNNLAEIINQNLRVAGIRTTIGFTDNPGPLGTVTDTGNFGDIDTNQVTRIDNSGEFYGNIAGPNLRWNIGPGKSPAPVGSSATLTITFSQLVTLASPLTLMDVDRDGERDGGQIFQDRVTVTAFNGASSVPLTGRAIGNNPTNTVTNSGNSVLAVGVRENATNNSNDGNVQVTVGGAIDRIQIVYQPGTEFGTPEQDETIGLAKLNICVPLLGNNGGSIGDTVFNDIDGDAVQDNGEPGIPNVQLTLTSPGPDGTLGTADDTTQTTTTDNNGNYSFTNLPGANYRVTLTPPFNFPQVTTPSLQNPSVQTNVSLPAGQSRLDVDFGLRRPPGGSIGDTVFNDNNSNGIQDQGESGIANVTLTLRNANNGQVVGTTTTNNNGNYIFTGLALGNYTVEVAPPNNLTATTNTTLSANLTQPNPDNSDVDFGFVAGNLTTSELRLVKRITAVLKTNGQRINYQTFVDDPSDDNDNALRPLPLGEFDVQTPLESNDEAEYTIYFRAGQALNNFNICDLIPEGTTYSPNSPIVVSLNGTNISAPNTGRFISALQPLPAGNSCVSQTNSNGAVIVNYPANIPVNSFGSVSFRVRIN